MRVIAVLFIFSALLIFEGCERAPETAGPGDLVWPEPVVEIELQPGECQREIRFPVRNRGPRAEIIESVTSECGCLLGDSSGLEIAPGKSTALPMVFRASALMSGTTIEKTVKVAVRGHETPAALVFRAKVPATVIIKPERLEWMKGDLSWKEVSLESPIEFDVVRIGATNSNFEWTPVNESLGKRKCTARVRPREDVPRLSLLTIETSLPAPWSKANVPLVVGGANAKR